MTTPVARTRRTFASEEERVAARNAYRRELYARKKAAAGVGEELAPKREQLPIMASYTEDRNAYMREYRASHVGYFTNQKRIYRARLRHQQNSETVIAAN